MHVPGPHATGNVTTLPYATDDRWMSRLSVRLLGGRKYWQTGDMSLHLSLSPKKGKGRLAAAVFLRQKRLPRDEKKDMQCTDDSISGQVKCCESVFPWPGAVQKAADAKWKKVWDFGCLVRLRDFLNQCQESRGVLGTYLYLFLRYLEVQYMEIKAWNAVQNGFQKVGGSACLIMTRYLSRRLP